MKISPQSDILLQTPFRETFFGVYAFGSSADNQLQRVFHSKVELGSHPSPVETINLKEPILSEAEKDLCFLKVGRYSKEDVVVNKRNYAAVVNPRLENEHEELVRVVPIR